MVKKIIFVFLFFLTGCSNQDFIMPNFVAKNVAELTSSKSLDKFEYEFVYVDSESELGVIVSQSVAPKSVVNEKVVFEVSNAKLLYEKLSVNELGRVPIMMYHGIVDTLDNKYTGGNVDINGYHRTVSAFKKDLDFYYNSGYRMIRLEDYINGIIDVPLGKSPLVLTFDDGIVNNFKVLGEENGKLIIDPNCAVGILEEYKKKYPDFNVTATFLLNGSMFFQSKYNEKILKWLVDNGYDVGNHTYSHDNLAELTGEEVYTEVTKMYDILDKYIKGKYIKVVSLPFGSPYKKDHPNFLEIMKTTDSTLRVGWESELSPFSKNFDKTFIKRIRAYDNNGQDFDIEYEFNKLLKSRFISDGDKEKITIPNSLKDYIKDDLKYDYYGG